MLALRILVACPTCDRQYDATGRPVGAVFRCTCGDRLEVPAPRPHEAAVVRCSSCGAPRQDSTASCRFCGGDFTLYEQDLDTLCPGCMSRISRKARFCHSCALPILVAGGVGEATDRPCPVCRGPQTLTSRRLGAEQVAVLECSRCAGLWLSAEAFRLLADRARRDGVTIVGHGAPAGAPIELLARQPGPAYRSCPTCGALMNRQNYGRRSGVILDVCKEHGVWFDDRELEGVIEWLRRGGTEVTELVREEERRAREERRRMKKLSEPALPPHHDRAEAGGVDLMAWLISWAVDAWQALSDSRLS